MLYNSVLFQYLNVSSCIVWSYVALIPNVNFKRGDSLLTNLFCLLLFFAWYAVWSTRCRADTFRSSLSSFLILRKSRSVYSYFSLKGKLKTSSILLNYFHWLCHSVFFSLFHVFCMPCSLETCPCMIASSVSSKSRRCKNVIITDASWKLFYFGRGRQEFMHSCN